MLSQFWKNFWNSNSIFEMASEYFTPPHKKYFNFMKIYLKSLAWPSIAGIFAWSFTKLDFSPQNKKLIKKYFRLFIIVWSFCFTYSWRTKRSTNKLVNAQEKSHKRFRRFFATRKLYQPRCIVSSFCTGTMLFVCSGLIAVNLNLQGYVQKDSKIG